jgi:CubicO group peptidase (beta-lactamase class C family)
MLRQGIPFSNVPGVAYEHSNYGFAILGRIVSRVSGLPYDVNQAEHPSAARHDLDDPSPVRGRGNRRAVGYRWEDERWKEEPPLPHGSFGSVRSSVTSQNSAANSGTFWNAAKRVALR